MLKEINNKTLKAGDLVLLFLVNIHENEKYDKLHSYGIVLSDKSAYMYCGKYFPKIVKYCYLIDNPTNDELEIKTKLLELWTSENQKILSKKLKDEKAKKNLEYAIGDVLEDSMGRYSVYLGKCEFHNKTKNSPLDEFYEGYVYRPLYYSDAYTDFVSKLLSSNLKTYLYYDSNTPVKFQIHGFDILKVKSKKFVKKIGNIKDISKLDGLNLLVHLSYNTKTFDEYFRLNLLEK